MIFDRVRGLQTKDTLTDPMAGFFVRKYLKGMNPIIDPFARNCEFAWPYTNDIDTSTNAEQHLDAEEFLKRMKDMRFGGAILDPPFSNHQSREIYGSENLYTDPAKMKRIAGNGCLLAWLVYRIHRSTERMTDLENQLGGLFHALFEKLEKFEELAPGWSHPTH